MKKIYLILLLLTVVSNITVNAIKNVSNTEYYSGNEFCPEFTMESEKELKELLKENGFADFDKKTKLSKRLANERISSNGIVAKVRMAEIRFPRNERLTDAQRLDLIKTLLTNHPEAIECIKENLKQGWGVWLNSDLMFAFSENEDNDIKDEDNDIENEIHD
jgi:hypothetical protein